MQFRYDYDMITVRLINMRLRYDYDATTIRIRYDYDTRERGTGEDADYL